MISECEGIGITPMKDNEIIITTGEICGQIHKTKYNKAPGPDGL